jgi:hypothetical protein
MTEEEEFRSDAFDHLSEEEQREILYSCEEE